MKLLFVLVCTYLSSLATAGKLSSASLTADNVNTGEIPKKITFGATVATPLTQNDWINVVAWNRKNPLVGIFKRQADQDFAVTIESGAPNCRATARTTSLVGVFEHATALHVRLANTGGGVCAISGAFSMSITDNIYQNAKKPDEVVFYMETSKDRQKTDTVVAYKVEPPKVSPILVVLPIIVWLFTATLVAVIAVIVKKNEKLESNAEIHEQQTDPKQIISNTNYTWYDNTGLITQKCKLLIGRNGKIEEVRDDLPNRCCRCCRCSFPISIGRVFHAADVKLVQTTVQLPFNCFVCCGEKIAWTLQKYFLWGTLGIVGLHRFALLPMPLKRSSWIMIGLEAGLGGAFLAVGGRIPGLGVALILWLIDGFLMYFWEPIWTVRIHLCVQNVSFLSTNHEIIEVPLQREAALQLRKDLYDCMKPYCTRFQSLPAANELETFVHPPLKFKNKSISIGQHHVTAAFESKTYKDYNDIFMSKISMLTYDLPPEYPFWYIVSGWCPPWGFCGVHRDFMKSGTWQERCLFGFTLGYCLLGWCNDARALFGKNNWLKKKGSIALNFPYSYFYTRVKTKEDAYTFFQNLSSQINLNVADERQVPAKVFKHRKRYWKDCCEYVFDCCFKKAYDDHSTIINRDNVVLTKTASRFEELCVPISPCFPICWLFSCCFKIKKTKEDTSMLFLKNVNKLETRQEDICCPCLPCCCNQDEIENYIHFPHTEQTAYFSNREDVTEAEALLTSYASRPKAGNAVFQPAVQVVQLPVFPVYQLQGLQFQTTLPGIDTGLEKDNGLSVQPQVVMQGGLATPGVQMMATPGVQAANTYTVVDVKE